VIGWTAADAVGADRTARPATTWRAVARDCHKDREDLKGVVGEATIENIASYRWMQVSASQRYPFAPRADFSLIEEICRGQPALCEISPHAGEQTTSLTYRNKERAKQHRR
jgi:hypothetical protein